MDENHLAARLREFMCDEAKSCSMDFGCITPEYVYRIWGGRVPLAEINATMAALSKNEPCC